jgi:hypothetical protein
MGFDKDAWVANYVAKGGAESDGRAIADKMQAATSQATQPSMLRRTNPNNNRNPLQPADAAASPDNTAASSGPDSTGELFDGEANQSQALTTPPAPAKPSGRRVAVKRGRKPTDFNDPNREPTQQELDLFNLSMEIDEKNAKESKELGFIATAMIYASLPHSEPEDNKGVFKRKNGLTSLTILNDPDIGLPFGKIPRIICAFLCTEAKKYKDTRGPEIFLGHSQTEFIEKMGMHNSGGDRGDITRYQDQAKRLFTSSITLIGEPGSQFHWRKVNIADEGMLLWNPHEDPEHRSQWQSKLTLSTPFYQECIEHSVPIDMRVLKKLRGPMAIDIYVWLTYRFHSIVYPTPVTWKQLQWQFGAGYPKTAQGERSFRTNFKKQLRNVLAVYRDANVDVQQDVLLLLPSKPHILPGL